MDAYILVQLITELGKSEGGLKPSDFTTTVKTVEEEVEEGKEEMDIEECKEEKTKKFKGFLPFKPSSNLITRT
jgi:hypothetical protein